MEEIKQLHELNLEWGSITKLMDKISDIEEAIEGGWPELIDMIIDAAMEEDRGKSSPETIFFSLYQFMFRLYYRLKRNPVKRHFNLIRKTTSLGVETYFISNYDYATFKWARSCGYGDEMSNDYIKIPVANLTEAQQRYFDRRAEKYPQ